MSIVPLAMFRRVAEEVIPRITFLLFFVIGAAIYPEDAPVNTVSSRERS